VDSIFYGQLRYGRAVPRYTTTGHSVSVVLPGGAANLEFVRWVVSEGRAGRNWALPELLLLRACAERRSLTTEEAARIIQSDVERARSVLSRLVEGGVVESRGERRGRSYHLSAEMYRVLGDKPAYVRTRGFEPRQQEASDLCRLTGPQASRLLNRVAALHPELVREGERRGTRYVWKGAPPQKRGRK
jgi:ATP-dependent DNA helicase RecG